MGRQGTQAGHQVEHRPIGVHLRLALSQDLCARAQAEDAGLVLVRLGPAEPMGSTENPQMVGQFGRAKHHGSMIGDFFPNQINRMLTEIS